MLSNIKFGRRTSTGVAFNVELGWIPSKVEVINLTSRNRLTYFSGMPAGSALKENLGVVSSYSAANGITQQGAQPGSTYQGFTVGADADVNTNATDVVWVAYRDGPGSGA